MEKQFQINMCSVSLRKVAIVSEDVITNSNRELIPY